MSFAFVRKVIYSVLPPTSSSLTRSPVIRDRILNSDGEEFLDSDADDSNDNTVIVRDSNLESSPTIIAQDELLALDDSINASNMVSEPVTSLTNQESFSRSIQSIFQCLSESDKALVNRTFSPILDDLTALLQSVNLNLEDFPELSNLLVDSELNRCFLIALTLVLNIQPILTG